MRLKNSKLEEINFTGGIHAWNREAFQGTDQLEVPGTSPSHPMFRRELPVGFMEDIVNLRFDSEGNLIQRETVGVKTLPAGKYPQDGVTKRARLATNTGQHDGSRETYLVCTVDNLAPFAAEFYRSVDASAVFFTANLVNASAIPTAVFYNGKWWVFQDESTSSYSVTGSVPTGFTAAFAGSATGLNKAIIWKDRCWGFSGSKMLYSKATDPSVWAAPDGGFFELPNKVGIRDYLIFSDQMYIIDKGNNLWVFVYYSDPATDGSLRQIISGNNLPVLSTPSASRALCVSNGALYVSSGINIYQVVNDNLYPIADQLALKLNGHDEVKLFDLGYGLLLHTYYSNGSSKTPDYYIYHHVTKSWTRYTFDLYSDLSYSNRYYLDNAHVYNSGYDAKFIMVFQGSTPPSTGTNYFPIMILSTSEAFFGDSMQDSFISTFDGNGAKQYRETPWKIKTGPIYLGYKNQYKKFQEFLLDGFLRQYHDGTNPNLTPYKTTVEFVPAAAVSKVDSLLQITSENDPTEYVYKIPIYQRARAVQLTIEREDLEVTSVFQDAYTLTENPSTRAFISRLYLLYQDLDLHRSLSSTTAYADSSSK